jgi:hypothetical protein
MTLGALIAHLSRADGTLVVPVGFARPHSYRGYYHDLAFEMEPNTTVGAMLEAARSALGSTYRGWKGGDFTMGEHTDVYLVAEEGECGEGIGPVLLGYMLGTIAHPAAGGATP